MSILELGNFDVRKKIKNYDTLVNDTHLLQMINIDDKNTIMKIDPIEANVYIGDFHGLLKSYNMPYEVLEIITTLNKLESSSDYRGDFVELLIPSQEIINNIINK